MNAYVRIAPQSPQSSGPNGRASIGRLIGGFMRGVTAGLAVAVGAVLALFAAVFVAALAVIGSVLVFLTGMVLRSRRRARPATGDAQVLEARKVGHAWVAYGWDQPAR